MACEEMQCPKVLRDLRHLRHLRHAQCKAVQSDATSNMLSTLSMTQDARLMTQPIESQHVDQSRVPTPVTVLVYAYRSINGTCGQAQSPQPDTVKPRMPVQSP
jgi:hypothetical protein